MAQLRLSAPSLVITVVIASCGRSEAAPQAHVSGHAAPKGWQLDGELAKTAASAAADPTAGITVAGSEAWSEPSRGCYAVWLDLRGGAAPIEVASEQLLAALARELPGLQLREVAKPVAADHGTLTLAFDTRGFHGRLRAELASTGEIHALACVWNRREPRACEAGCTTLLGGPP